MKRKKRSGDEPITIGDGSLYITWEDVDMAHDLPGQTFLKPKNRDVKNVVLNSLLAPTPLNKVKATIDFTISGVPHNLKVTWNKGVDGLRIKADAADLFDITPTGATSKDPNAEITNVDLQIDGGTPKTYQPDHTQNPIITFYCHRLRARRKRPAAGGRAKK